MKHLYIRSFLTVLALSSLFACPSVRADSAAAPAAKVYIISPKDGDTVSSPVTVLFGLKGMGVAPAGVDKENTGHHHLLVDTDLPPLNQPIPKDAQHLHFGGGQTETTISLPPGKHTLQLLFGNAMHIPGTPPLYSDKITITVK